MKRIACIIPAYNEAVRIGSIINLALSHPLIDEVIVVDDGSSDRTSIVASTFKKAQVITLPKNCGKSFAVQTGILASESEYIMLLDADLAGLTSDDISELIKPILDGKTDVMMSLRGDAMFICLFLGLEYISGDRIFPRKLITKALLEKMMDLPRFGLEVFLNDLFIQNHFRIGVVFWKNVLNPGKIQKCGFFVGIISQTKMVFNIFQTIGVLLVISQNIQMIKLLVLRPVNIFSKKENTELSVDVI